MAAVPLYWLDWPAPKAVKACFSLRAYDDTQIINAPKSQAPFNDFNFGLHVGDEEEIVAHHRQSLTKTIEQNDIQWLDQVHGIDVVKANGSTTVKADAVYTPETSKVCAVMTADCLPVFFCDAHATQVAVAHAGWRGLASGVLQHTLAQFNNPESVLVYFGPAISQKAFEVGGEVRDAFVKQSTTLDTCFIPKANNKYMADLYGLAKVLLSKKGVTQFFGGDRCTFSEASKFFSYRRDGQTGRMVNLIWME